MKKLFLSALLVIGMIASAQTTNVTYTALTSVITNPERGFYHAVDTGITTASYGVLSQSELSSFRLDENVSVILREFWMNDFRNGSLISQAYLNNMQSDFNALRNSGTKAIIRFGYSKLEGTVAQQPTKAQILAHIAQLAPVVNANKDVIVCIQAGFIGTWGEWYYSNSTEFGTSDYENWTNAQWANRNEVLTAMENSFSVELPLQVRYIYVLDKLRPQGTSRIGIYNDAFLNTWGDQGTFYVGGVNETNPVQESYLQTLTTNLPMTGETDGINSPRTDCANALLEMDKYNWSVINTDYLQAIITNWKNNGCYPEMQKKLGYRFELINSSVTNNVLTFKVQNVGFANVFKNRGANIVLRNTVSAQEYRFPLNTSLKDWKTGQVITITQDVNYNIPNAQYKLFLELPDANLTNNTAYSIRCANNNVWVSTNGYNDLQQTITINRLGVEIFVIDNVVQISKSDKFYFKIYDMNGRDTRHASLDISDLPDGYYIIWIKTRDGKVYTKKVYKK